MCKNRQLADCKTGDDRCERCKRLNCAKCHCWDFMDAAKFQSYKDQLKQMVQEHHNNDWTKLKKIEG